MKAGLHCGDNRVENLRYATRLFPAVKAGLHCGGRHTAASLAIASGLFPAVKAGLHCGDLRRRQVAAMLAALPGREGRAPLRLVGGVPIPRRGPPLFPAVKAGLHCGGLKDLLDDNRFELFPAVKAGLHCGLFRRRR